jgi:lipopolysaccharide export system protein LptC
MSFRWKIACVATFLVLGVSFFLVAKEGDPFTLKVTTKKDIIAYCHDDFVFIQIFNEN